MNFLAGRWLRQPIMSVITRSRSRLSKKLWCLLIVIFVSLAIYCFIFSNAERCRESRKRARVSPHHRNKVKEDRAPRYVYHGWTGATKREYVVSGDGHIFIVGATGINSTAIGSWDKINVYGQRLAGNHRLQCCLKYPDGKISQKPVETEYKFYTTGTVPLPVFNVVCGNARYKLNGKHGDIYKPVAVSVVLVESSCESPSVGFIEPYFPLRQAENTLAITTKISHGNLSPDLLITWMEAYLWLGVDKVITHALSNITSNARTVLEYYAKRDVLELYDYQIPGIDFFPRYMQVPWLQTWTDSAAAMFDAYARNIGYTYFSVIDWDEFIIPSRNRTLKQLMNNLFHKRRSAAGFKFQSQYFITSVEPEASDVFLKKHVNRLKSQPVFDRPKIIFKPDRARITKSHDIEPYQGYMLSYSSSSEAYIRHFRDCKPPNSHVGKCAQAKDLELVRDTETAEWAENISRNVRRVKAEIFH